MDTFFARNRLSAYLDGALPAAEAREVESALARDAALREELDRLREAVELLRGEGLVEAPPGFSARVRSRIDREPMQVGWRLWIRQARPEAVMLAAAALLVVVYVGQHRGDSRPSPASADTVAAGGAFGAGDEGTGQVAVDRAGEAAQSAENAPTAEAATAGDDIAAAGLKPAPSAVSMANDGVLGNEPSSAPATPSQSMAQRMPKVKTTSKGAELEPWQPEWEKDAAVADDGAQRQEVTFYSPAPFRYRVVANDARALKSLAAIAQELGGELQDSRGRPVAAWSLEQGETRSVRVAVPAYNAGTLAARLRELGEVETVQQKDTLLADPNANVPVQVELSF